MLDSLINLPAFIPSLWRSLQAGKKRRTTISRTCFASVEDLEVRQLLSAANGNPERGGVPRIVNGTTTTDFAAVGALTFTPTIGSAVQSTGTLITSEWVLTSASASKGLTQTGGTATVILGGVTYTVDQIVTYPKYNASSVDYRQDIALWHVTTTVDPLIVPLEISYTKAVVGNTMTLVGFGKTGDGTTGATGAYGTKQTATTKLQAVTGTQLTYKLDNNLEGITAAGDQGGPLLYSVNGDLKIFGVVSGQSTTTSKIGTTAYNTRVDLYGGWIDDTIGIDHPIVATVDDYVDTADIVGSTNRLFNVTTTTNSFSFRGKLSQFGDVDVFKVVTAADGLATLNLTNYAPTSGLLDTKLEILAADGETVLFTKDDNSATDLSSKLQTNLTAGTYFVRVSTYANAGKGEYNLSMTSEFAAVSNPNSNASSFTAVGALTFTPATGSVINSSGTLITSQWILTSASASKGLTVGGGNTATVVLGAVTYTVDQIVTYPKYNTSSIDYRQDIALWHVTTAVDEAITPMTISRTKAAVGNSMSIVGFGTSASAALGTKKLTTGKLTGVTASLLQYKLASTPGAAAQGSAMLYNVGGVMNVFGVVSGQSTTAKIGATAYNTRVDLYAGWIDDTIGGDHPEVATVDDYVDTADTVGSTNQAFSLNASTKSFTVNGKFSQYGDVDVFKVVTAADGLATLNLTNKLPTAGLLDTKLEILAADGTTVLHTSDDISATNLSSMLQIGLEAGTYFVRVSTYADAGMGDYTLSMTVDVDNVGDTILTATTLTAAKQGSFAAVATINSNADVDYFKVTLKKSGNYNFDFARKNPTLLDPTISVYSSLGVLLGTNDNFIAGTKDSRLKLDGLTIGTVLYVSVSSSDSLTSGVGNLSIRKA